MPTPRDDDIQPSYARTSPHDAEDDEPQALLLPKLDTVAKSEEQTLDSLLKIATAAAAAKRYDDSIAAYTQLLQRNGSSSQMRVSTLLGRCDAYLLRAREGNDPVDFGRAAADARRLVALRPNWEEAWMRLGGAHLENGCPARARHAFRKGAEACAGSVRLREGLRDAQFVIDSEGAETDWEEPLGEDSGSCSSEERFEDSLDSSERCFRGWGRRDAVPRSFDSLPRGFDTVPRNLTAGPRSLELGKDRRVVRENSMKRFSSGDDRRRLKWDSREKGRSDLDLRESEARKERDRLERLKIARERRAWVRMQRERAERDREERERERQSEGRAVERVEADETMESGVGAEAKHTEHDDGASSSVAMGNQKLYDLLQVPKNASEASIKKSYYNLARRYHPDKNRDDVEAKEKFQKLAEAYRVLSDPESRALYDRYGDKGLVKNSVDIIDPSTLFAMVFGSDQFVSLIGELQLASLACNVDENGTAPTTEVLNSIQKQRVGKLVLEMVKTLKPYVDGDKKGFLSSTHRQMRKLKQASFGPSLLYTVGNVYVQQTNYLLDKTRPFNLSAMMRKASLRSHRIASQHKAMSAAARVMDKQKRLHDRVMKSGKDIRSISDEEAKKIAEEMAQNAIDMMWKISVIDIETTLEDVVSIVLSGRDLIADEDIPISLDRSAHEFTGQAEKSKRRLRIGSHLGLDRRDYGDRSRGDSDRNEVGLIRLGPALGQGQPAVTRQQILSERAHGIRATGRIFMSAMK